MIFDSSQKGLSTIFKDYQLEAMSLFWENPGIEYSSRQVWEAVNERIKPRTISRASIINFCNFTKAEWLKLVKEQLQADIARELV